MHLFNYKLNVRVTFFLSQAYFLWQDLNFCRLSNTGFSLRLNTGYGPRMTSIIQGIKCNVCLLFCQTNFFLSLFFLVLRYLFSDVLAGIQSTMHCFPLCVFLRYFDVFDLLDNQSIISKPSVLLYYLSLCLVNFFNTKAHYFKYLYITLNKQFPFF